MIIHIRKGNQGGKDKRLALRHGRPGSNMAKPTLCGADPGGEDMSKPDGEQWLYMWRPLLGRKDAPSWLAPMDERLCPECAATLKSTTSEKTN